MKPNFFIVGAPKCGTTALAEYLSTHPNIYMSPIKEPHYFAADFWQHHSYYIRTEKEYLSLFAASNSQHTVLGEASVWYLYSSCAISNIYTFNPNAKIIVMVRNPINMMYSLHSQMYFSTCEDVENFEDAFRLEDRRAKGENIPRACQTTDSTAQLLQYSKICKLGNQVERLFSIFRQEQIKIIVFDDLVKSSLETYKDVTAFLGLDYDGRTQFPRVNSNTSNRVRWLANLYRNPPAFLVQSSNYFKNLVGLKSWGLIRQLNQVNSYHKERTPLTAHMRSILADNFRDDIEKLSKLINRDLTHWVNKLDSV